jgi:hypothetical protein
MKLHYRLIKDANGFLAECVESDAMGEGKTAKEAVASLKKSLQERMFRPDAVAPPPEQEEPEIELVLADDRGDRADVGREVDYGGPGEPARTS